MLDILPVHSSMMADFELVIVMLAIDYHVVAGEVELRPRVVEVDQVLGYLPMIVAKLDVAVPSVTVFLAEPVEPMEAVVVYLAELVEPMEVALEAFAALVEPMVSAAENLFGMAVSTDSWAVSPLVLVVHSTIGVFAEKEACPSCASIVVEPVSGIEVVLVAGPKVAEHLSEVVLVLLVESRMADHEKSKYWCLVGSG